MLPTIEQLVVSYTISDPVLPQMQDLMVHHEIQEPSAHIPAIEQGVYRYQPERLITASQQHPLAIGIAFVPCESRMLQVLFGDEPHVHQTPLRFAQVPYVSSFRSCEYTLSVHERHPMIPCDLRPAHIIVYYPLFLIGLEEDILHDRFQDPARSVRDHIIDEDRLTVSM